MRFSFFPRTSFSRWVVVVVVLALALGVWALPDAVRPTSAQQAAAVSAGDNFFEPKTITVAVGTTVTWTNNGQRPHTVTSDTGVFDSGTTQDKWLRNPQTFQFTFTQAGTFPYYCVLHGGPGGIGMAGTVVVQAAQGQPAPAPAQQAAPAVSMAITLGPGRDASQTGTALLVERGNQTEVNVSIVPGPAGVEQPAHIHEGLCPGVGAVRFPLTNVVNGRSTTIVNAPLRDLLTGGFSINVHRSQAEINVYVACGNIPQGVVFNLNPGRDASQPGRALLRANGPQTEVVVTIAPGPSGVRQPIHIHEGLCPGVGAVKFPLTDVVNGESRSLINAPLRDLQAGNMSINAHKSQAEINVYVACGNIPAAPAAPPPPPPPAAPPPAAAPAVRPPATGNAGLQASDSSSNIWLYVAAAAGVVLLTGSSVVALARVRSRR